MIFGYRVSKLHTCNTDQLKEAFWRGVVVAPLIGKVELAHLIDTTMNIGHEPTDRTPDFRLCKREREGGEGERERMLTVTTGKCAKEEVQISQ